MPDSHNQPIAQAKLHWYRIPLDRALLAELNQRGDACGFAQTLGHLGIIIATGAGQVFLPPELRRRLASLVMSRGAVASHACAVVVSYACYVKAHCSA